VRHIPASEHGRDEINTYWVYILASRPWGTLYIGVTNDILGRVGRHRERIGSKFTGRYRVHQLVWFEEFVDPSACDPRASGRNR
jgi:predicted GIY-YIG superfamily endonuclease